MKALFTVLKVLQLNILSNFVRTRAELGPVLKSGRAELVRGLACERSEPEPPRI